MRTVLSACAAAAAASVARGTVPPSSRSLDVPTRPQAQAALDEGEVPVGCVVVRDGAVAATGSNKTNETRNVSVCVRVCTCVGGVE